MINSPAGAPAIRGVQDRQTVSADGTSLATDLDGVIVNRPPVHVDHRGALLEMFTGERFWEAPFAYAYQTSIRPGMLKGWFLHEEKLDRYHLVCGELLVLLYDDRPESPTRGQHQKLVLGEASGARQVLIPPRVWHLSLNVGAEDAILVNLPSTHYDHENPDRFHVDIDSGTIPVDVRSFFPVTYAGPRQIAATFH
ncbi:dTDP-4-dehydrorhamnose 3,5-epimerase family protein [Nocardioides sp. LMS-CY]|uniref:dTDP-4-dehydrorhamnose 3,5-epimerase n=1 Tax=Nocardioides soli TaxID=1036020 RepID=A0A7W4Z040_9ACTN|nr:dTDP-4-dehydrorhamnose 3,5-epimerase family protein [Nocardioides sp. LMS-CY]MBB3041448.1 dTDP-4-dehydrorhamnose 3,5-epimerase [Nocardioides soli]QWF23372.1 dTDP-4-dehydrorhamnose 3,5-epimerase family protein [Nocardioides sp. LMS-CY]